MKSLEPELNVFGSIKPTGRTRTAAEVKKPTALGRFLLRVELECLGILLNDGWRKRVNMQHLWENFGLHFLLSVEWSSSPVLVSCKDKKIIPQNFEHKSEIISQNIIIYQFKNTINFSQNATKG
jgi:hypothetical protein